MSQQVYTKTLFEDEVIAAGAYAESAVIDVNSMRPLGQFASHLKVVGAGNVDIDLYCSINGDDYVLYDTLYSGYAVGSYLELHSVAVCVKFKVRATEKSGSDGVTVSQWMGVQ